MSDEKSVLETVKRILEEVGKLDLTPLFELDRQLTASAELRAEFVRDPFKVAERYGFKLQKSLLEEGIHFHWIDTDNNYYPAEGSAIEQLQKNTMGNLGVELR
ncbi:hypothetical protein [Picrophilus oshimae]|uniref:hypothetical protein n=1 Tax=Picrophilus oshimae TaxID=46632 RepID=UPI00064E5997|nr:hypothetical protein [Picrophilus oshimae]